MCVFELVQIEVGPQIDRQLCVDGLEAFGVGDLDIVALFGQVGAVADPALFRPAGRLHVPVIQDRALGVGDIAASFVEGKIDDLVDARVVGRNGGTCAHRPKD